MKIEHGRATVTGSLRKSEHLVDPAHQLTLSRKKEDEVLKKPSLSTARRSKVFFVDGGLQRGSSPHATLCRFAAIIGIATLVPATSTGVTLSVSNAYGTAVPAPGDHAFTSGTPIVCRVTDSPTSLGSGTQRVCTGWSGTGSVPADGTATNASVTVTNDSSITWHWSLQYPVDITRMGNGRVVPDIAWYESGGSTTLVAVADEHCTFLGWPGDTSGSTSSGSQLTLPIDRTRMITSHFTVCN